MAAVSTDGSRGATVRDEELAGIAEALEKRPREWGILSLADSKAAIQTVKKARRTGKARMGDLVRVMDEVRRRQKQGQWWGRRS